MAAFVVGAGAGIALYDWLGSKGQRLTITDNITTNMSINAVTNIQTECFSSVEGSQVIDITSNPHSGFVGANPNPCTICLDALFSIQQSRTELEEEAQLKNPGYTAQVANPQLQSIMITGQKPPDPAVTQGVDALGPCTAMCSDIVVVGIQQNQQFAASQTCQVQDNVTTNIAQTIKGQIDATLKNQQDIIGQLEDAFTSNSDSISTNLSNTMSQNLTSNFTQTLHTQMKNAQTVRISGSSMIINSLTQSFTGSMVGNLTVNNTVVDQLRQSAQYSIAQTLLNKNDTIGDLSQDFLQIIETMSDLVEELTSQMLIIIGAILAAVIVMVGALYVFSKNFRGWFKSKVNATVDTQINKLRAKAFAPSSPPPAKSKPVFSKLPNTKSATH
jgi:hypothetical protein